MFLPRAPRRISTRYKYLVLHYSSQGSTVATDSKTHTALISAESATFPHSASRQQLRKKCAFLLPKIEKITVPKFRENH